MQDLLPRAERISQLLKDRGETIVVAESSTGGLVSAALLAMPGASAYFLGGAIVYTQAARKALSEELYQKGLRAQPTDPALAIKLWESALRYDPQNAKAAARLKEARPAY